MKEHRVSLDCDTKLVTLRTPTDKEIVMIGEHRDYLSNVIFALVAEKLVHKGCDAYLAYILDTNVDESVVENIHIVREFFDVFPEELPDLPSKREVDFEIELLLGTTPVSTAPYCMAPKEHKELKVLLQELLDRVK